MMRTRRRMKFGKRLRRQIERTVPEWRDKFLRYKDLKKQIRLVSGAPAASSHRRRAARAFIRMLDAEVEKLNAFFVEREEDLVIRHKELQDRLRAAVESPAPSAALFAAEMATIRSNIVDLHGEMVLLLNYSSVNYTGLAKILKKYDKRSGDLLRPPIIERVLAQPFFATDLISNLVKECENSVDWAFQRRGEEGDESRAPPAGAAARQSILFENAVAALVTIRDLRRGSSTYGRFSLPPLS